MSAAGELHGCITHRTQLRNKHEGEGNRDCNNGATTSLKALAHKVLKRNAERNRSARDGKSGCNNNESLRATDTEEMQPVVVHRRTFRKCCKCGRMGWYPQASAEICCGAAMILVEQPAMSVHDFVEFVGCPKSYASGAISQDEVLDMMRRDQVTALKVNESDIGGSDSSSENKK
ncbi:hypothetical protein FEF65_02725 [Mariprofundus erugo]|uniref:Uncharacterized protein n=1 Tax=Mariprofundus erugo TaxID=2528639 RepID=A0A5R9GXB7_9PROT|nr:hypothetical protein [Mariprofundus erugo]TLS68637.1 hypothetical protein FEF65_02725 [Mariprofundus erugo]